MSSVSRPPRGQICLSVSHQACFNCGSITAAALVRKGDGVNKVVDGDGDGHDTFFACAAADTNRARTPTDVRKEGGGGSITTKSAKDKKRGNEKKKKRN